MYAKELYFGYFRTEMACLVDELQIYEGRSGHSRAPDSVQVTSHGGRTLSIGQKHELLAPLTEVPDPKHIPLPKSKLFAKMGEFGIAFYHLGANHIAFIAVTADIAGTRAGRDLEPYDLTTYPVDGAV